MGHKTLRMKSSIYQLTEQFSITRIFDQISQTSNGFEIELNFEHVIDNSIDFRFDMFKREFIIIQTYISWKYENINKYAISESRINFSILN